MKKLTKLFPMVLMAATLISCGGPSLKGSTFIEPEVHYVSGTLHEVNVTESNIPFAANGVCDYTIIYQSGSEWARRAASFILSHVNRATDATIEMMVDDGVYAYNTDSKLIVLGVDRISAQAGVTLNEEKKIGNGGYQLITKDNSVFVHVNSGYGYVHAARTFLQHTLGYEIYSAELTVYTKDGSTLPIFEVYEAPDMTYRMQSNKMEANAAYEMGFLSFSEAFFNKNNIKTQHNTFDYFNPSEYINTHPKWFADNREQICYTAHGDQEEYDAMINLLFEKLKYHLTLDPEQATFSFTIEDKHTMCMCDACVDNINLYGADSASVVLFLNDVDDLLQAYLQEQATLNNTKVREVNIVFFAYLRTEQPPVITNPDGTYSPMKVRYYDDDGNIVETDEDFVCNEHVVPYIAPIYADYVNSFYAEENVAARQIIEGWKVLNSKTYFWLYETNYSHYLYPFNSFSQMSETYRYCVNVGADFMFNEGQHNQGSTPAFGRFKEFFNYKAQYDVNLEYQDIVDDFFTNYFGPAKEPMLQLFYEIQDHLFYLADKYPADVGGSIYQDIAQAHFWPKKLLDHYVDLCNQAYELIEPLYLSDYNLYNVYYKNILLESIFPRYAILEHHRGQYTRGELKEIIDQFSRDAELLKVTNECESESLQAVLDSWRPS